MSHSEASPISNLIENQITSASMSNREALKIEAAALDPLTSTEGIGGFLATIYAVTAVGAVVFFLLAYGSGDTLPLTVLGVCAMLGIFMLFGIFAGHVRIGARLPAGDILKAAHDTAEEPALVASPSGNVLYWNPAYDTLFGKSENGPLAALESTFAGDPEASQAFFRLMRAAERGETRREEVRLKMAAGARRQTWVRLTVKSFPSPVRDAIDATQRENLVLWSAADITDERTREVQRIGALETALSGFDSMPAGFMSVSANGALGHVNATFESWLGYEAGGLRGRGTTLADLAGEDGAKVLGQLAMEADAERRSVDLDLTRDDGRIVPLTLFAEPAGTGFTITGLKRTGRGISGGSASEVRLSHFFRSAPFGIATLDKLGRVSSSNAAFARMMPDGRLPAGVPAIEALGRHAETHERQQLEAGLASVLSGRGNVTPIDITSGELKQTFQRVYLSPLADGNAQEAATLYLIDTTEQRALEARYAQAQKMEAVGKLAGGIAHDFNNVLTAIIGFSDLLLQTHRPSDPAYKDIKNIQSAANRAAGLVANLLGFSRKQTQQVSVLNLSEFATDMTPVLKTLCGEKIELKIQSERDLWYVRADRDQIYNVILNLAGNARDAMPSGGKLSIRTKNITERESQRMSHAGFTHGEYVMIEIEDTGTGMSAEVMEKIFEPFFTTKGIGKGTGLGLASVYGIVKQSGGFILPQSELGKGTVFKVYLPRHVIEADEDVEAQAQSKAAAKKETRHTDLTGTGRVLLVEDEVEVRQFAVRALKRQGYEVMEAADGVEALELMRANPGKIDLVVSDVVMPEMDGPTLFKELRKDNPLIKVIFVSGYPNEAFRESLGTDDFAFLPKPFSLPQLAEKVKEELMK